MQERSLLAERKADWNEARYTTEHQLTVQLSARIARLEDQESLTVEQDSRASRSLAAELEAASTLVGKLKAELQDKVSRLIASQLELQKFKVENASLKAS